MNEYVPKIVHLPGTTLSPEVVLHRTFDKLDRVKALIVVIQWDDDTFDLDWSSIKTADMCMASFVLHDAVATIAKPNPATVEGE